MNYKERRIKVILAKVGLDGHDRGINMIATWLRDAGMEVVYLGRFLAVEEVVITAMQESADIVGLSFLAGDHLLQVAKLQQNMKERNLRIPLVIGGIIPDRDLLTLKEMGVSAVFSHGTPLEKVVQRIREICNGK